MLSGGGLVLVHNIQAIGIIGAQGCQQTGGDNHNQVDNGDDGHRIGLDLLDNVPPDAPVVNGAKILRLLLHPRKGMFIEYRLIFHWQHQPSS